jgi:FMN reductase
MPVLACLGGSLRERSVTRAALQAAANIARDKGFEVDMLDVRELNLPMYVPDVYNPDEYEPQHRDNIRRFVESCRRADAMIWASPTYHGTMSGVVKNALDFVELMSNDARPYLHQMPVGLIVVNDTVTLSSMMNAVYELRAWVAPTTVMVRRDCFDPDLQTLLDERTARRLGRMVDNLLFFLKTGQNEARDD